ncbi:MAG: hypothetical protein ACEQSB_03540 [Undibacterium sp.]
MKVIPSFGRQSFRLLSVVTLILTFRALFGPKLLALWNKLDKGDPWLEGLATILTVILVALVTVLVHHAKVSRQRT